MNGLVFSAVGIVAGMALVPTISAQAAKSTGGTPGAGQGYGAVSGFEVSNVGYNVGPTGDGYSLTDVHFRIVHQGGALVDGARTAVNVVVHRSDGARTTAACTVQSSDARCVVSGIPVALMSGITVEAHDR